MINDNSNTSDTKKRHIVFVLDNNYIFPARVTVKSVIESRNKDNNSSFIFHFVGIDENKDLTEICGGPEFCKFYNDSCISKYKTKIDKTCRTFGYISDVAWCKIYLHQILGKDVEKALYLDCDTLVDGDLETKELFDAEFTGDCVIIGVEDPNSAVFKRSAKMSNDSQYINSGVMFLNLKKIREQYPVDEEFDKIALEASKYVTSGDQTVINKIFNHKIQYVSRSYNYLGIMDAPGKVYVEHPKIYHFTGRVKIWNIRPNMPSMQHHLKKYRKYAVDKYRKLQFELEGHKSDEKTKTKLCYKKEKYSPHIVIKNNNVKTIRPLSI